MDAATEQEMEAALNDAKLKILKRIAAHPNDDRTGSGAEVTLKLAEAFAWLYAPGGAH